MTSPINFFPLCLLIICTVILIWPSAIRSVPFLTGALVLSRLSLQAPPVTVEQCRPGCDLFIPAHYMAPPAHEPDTLHEYQSSLATGHDGKPVAMHVHAQPHYWARIIKIHTDTMCSYTVVQDKSFLHTIINHRQRAINRMAKQRLSAACGHSDKIQIKLR